MLVAGERDCLETAADAAWPRPAARAMARGVASARSCDRFTVEPPSDRDGAACMSSRVGLQERGLQRLDERLARVGRAGDHLNPGALCGEELLAQDRERLRHDELGPGGVVGVAAAQ